MGRKRAWRSVAAFLSALCLPILSGTTARAAMSLSADPYYEAEVRPGETVARDIHIRNRGAQPVRIRVEVWDYAQDSRGNAITRPAGSLSAGAGHWIAVSPREFILASGAARIVRAAVSIPPPTPTGTFGAVVFFAGEALEAEPAGTGARVVGKLGTLVLMRVRGTDPFREAGGISGIQMPRVALAYPVLISFRYRNSGNVHSRVSAAVGLRPLAGGPAVVTRAGEMRVLPGAEVAFRTSLPHGPALAAYRVSVRAENEAGEPLAAVADAGTVLVVSWQFAAGVIASTLGGAIAAKVIGRRPPGPRQAAAGPAVAS